MKVFLLTALVFSAVLSSLAEEAQRERRAPFLFNRPRPILNAIGDFVGDLFDGNRDAQDRPNVILLVADDMGVGDLTVYGHPTQEPGFIDEMAAKGMRFTDAYVGDSVCTPSRSAIMTGKIGR